MARRVGTVKPGKGERLKTMKKVICLLTVISVMANCATLKRIGNEDPDIVLNEIITFIDLLGTAIDPEMSDQDRAEYMEKRQRWVLRASALISLYTLLVGGENDETERLHDELARVILPEEVEAIP